MLPILQPDIFFPTSMLDGQAHERSRQILPLESEGFCEGERPVKKRAAAFEGISETNFLQV